MAREMSRLMFHVMLGAVTIVASMCVLQPAMSQSRDGDLPITTHLLWGGYIYGKLVDYYNRSLAHFETLPENEKDRDRDIMIGLSVNLERSVRAMRCQSEVLEIVEALE